MWYLLSLDPKLQKKFTYQFLHLLQIEFCWGFFPDLQVVWSYKWRLRVFGQVLAPEDKLTLSVHLIHNQIPPDQMKSDFQPSIHEEVMQGIGLWRSSSVCKPIVTEAILPFAWPFIALPLLDNWCLCDWLKEAISSHNFNTPESLTTDCFSPILRIVRLVRLNKFSVELSDSPKTGVAKKIRPTLHTPLLKMTHPECLRSTSYKDFNILEGNFRVIVGLFE